MAETVQGFQVKLVVIYMNRKSSAFSGSYETGSHETDKKVKKDGN